jgi:UDP-GlcNAc:undecaprenyl-phosphate GlcNAc-1-phosphate transferase
MGRRLARKIFVERDLSVSALKAMFQADREHIHHALVEMGFTHRKAVLILYGLTAILGVFAVFAAIYENDRVSLGLILAGMGGFVFVRQFAWAKGFLSKNGSSLLPP